MARNNTVVDDIDNDLDEQGMPKVVVPDNDEYYTLDLTRGKPNEDNLADEDIAGDDPFSDDDDKSHEGTLIHNNKKMANTNSNAGGLIESEDSVTQDSDSGSVPGEPGHWGVDEGTE